jgi:hypothetical protein
MEGWRAGLEVDTFKSYLSNECPKGSLMLWGDETMSALDGPREREVSNI